MRVDDVEFPAVRYAAVSPVQAGSCARARWRRAAVGATAASLCLALAAVALSGSGDALAGRSPLEQSGWAAQWSLLQDIQFPTSNWTQEGENFGEGSNLSGIAAGDPYSHVRTSQFEAFMRELIGNRSNETAPEPHDSALGVAHGLSSDWNERVPEDEHPMSFCAAYSNLDRAELETCVRHFVKRLSLFRASALAAAGLNASNATNATNATEPPAGADEAGWEACFEARASDDAKQACVDFIQEKLEGDVSMACVGADTEEAAARCEAVQGVREDLFRLIEHQGVEDPALRAAAAAEAAARLAAAREAARQQAETDAAIDRWGPELNASLAAERNLSARGAALLDAMESALDKSVGALDARAVTSPPLSPLPDSLSGGAGGAGGAGAAPAGAAAERAGRSEALEARPPPPSLPYKVNTSRPSLRTNWTRLVPLTGRGARGAHADAPPTGRRRRGARGGGRGGGGGERGACCDTAVAGGRHRGAAGAEHGGAAPRGAGAAGGSAGRGGTRRGGRAARAAERAAGGG